MNNIVLCLSTLGDGANPLVRSISAVRFDVNQVDQHYFHRYLKLQPQIDRGATITESALNHYTRVGPVVGQKYHPETVIDLFAYWLTDAPLDTVWTETYGSDFATTERLFTRYHNSKIPWLPKIASIDTALLLKQANDLERPENYCQYDSLDRARYRAEQIQIFLECIDK